MRNGLVTLVLVVGMAALLYVFLFNDEPPQTISYSGEPESFLSQVEAGKVSAVLMKGEKLEVTLVEFVPNSDERVVVESFVPAQFTTQVQANMIAACEAGSSCVNLPIFEGEPAEDGNAFLGLLLSMMFPILLIGVLIQMAN